MKIESVKNVNITLLFASPLNHLLISQKELFDKFKSEGANNDQHSFIEAPGLKVLVFPKMQKEIVFEATRILISDKTGKEVDKSDIIGDLEKIKSLDIVEQNKLSAYGFNYDAVVVPDNGNFDIKDLVSDKIAAIENIKSAGINILFEKDRIIYTLEIKPIKNDGRFIAHFNAHYNSNELPSEKKLKGDIESQFSEFSHLLKKI
ncbi:hypothetical protein A2Y83_01740 [Candidatus Falkowbacteria bacterium RBG_13_39_14]|uniref:Uncharacterized protein n=1 Tax=Candidatus Falkowbacteria bacterium RBG_13_39_14 TaxID=1797985 RepID=A0A1F5S5M4_9BACT|nr:MAG: hypothetical protein A2Y83_01740 [Candidatus Falkowbacteria bacterium RBG_13_39_14]